MEELTEEQKNRIAEAAREVLEQLLELMEVPGTVNLAEGYFLKDGKETGDTIALDIEGEELGLLIGRRGQTLAGLQYLIRIIVAEKTGSQAPIIIDVEGYRRRRCESLRNLAWQVAEQVKTRKTPLALEPMSPFDRRVVHLALSSQKEVTTKSTGVGDFRKVVVLPQGWAN